VTYLVDTNVLLRFAYGHDPAHPVAKPAVDRLQLAGHRLVTVFQNRSEFWNVSTRPAARNGYGLDVATAEVALDLIEQQFPILPEHPQTYPIWRRLVVSYAVRGIQVHDARLAAAMLAHGVTHVLTFNGGDFVRFAAEGLVAVDPAAV